ncbi:MAG: minor capsid protein [Methanomicrobiaceae archaeon]|nr:minor capsid protein [Methanomicrobiaceae archaeon]
MSLAYNPFQNLSESINLIVTDFSVEEEVLQALRNYIEQRTAEAKSNLISLLSQQITVAYLEGAARAATEVGDYEPVGLAGLDPVIESLAPRLDEAFGNLSGELTGIIDSGIRKNTSYIEVQRELQKVLKSGWGNTITFDSVGKTRRYVHVNPDGSLKWKEKVIKKKITLPTETYADTLSRTQMKSAFAYGHQQKYIESGREGWVYLCVSDERSRPHHVALHGRVFIFGTEESDMALEVMKDYNCRCRQKAWFNDSKLDKDPSVYEKQRKEWAKKALEELPESKKDGDIAKFLQNVIGEESEIDLNQIIYDKEYSIRSRATEKCYLFDEKEGAIFSKVGTKDHIGFTRKELDLFPGRILTHNHPSGSSFSPGDLMSSGNSGLKEIRAIGTEYRYSMKPPEGHETFTSELVKDIQRDFETERMRLYPKYYGKVINNELSEVQAWKEHSHEIWNSIASARGFRYVRETWK